MLENRQKNHWNWYAMNFNPKSWWICMNSLALMIGCQGGQSNCAIPYFLSVQLMAPPLWLWIFIFMWTRSVGGRGFASPHEYGFSFHEYSYVHPLRHLLFGYLWGKFEFSGHGIMLPHEYAGLSTSWIFIVSTPPCIMNWLTNVAGLVGGAPHGFYPLKKYFLIS
jgi:hypothetical protein